MELDHDLLLPRRNGSDGQPGPVLGAIHALLWASVIGGALLLAIVVTRRLLA